MHRNCKNGRLWLPKGSDGSSCRNCVRCHYGVPLTPTASRN